MGFDKKLVFDYIATADSWINLDDALGEINIRDLTTPLINSINDDGGVSYVLETSERYRASTTATVLEMLDDVNLLPANAVHHMQDHLYWLRDNFTPLSTEDDKITKASEDSDAWGIDEAPSVWTTSKVIISLMATRFTRRDCITQKQRADLRDSVYWLAGQAYSDGGWGYQKYQNSNACSSSVPMTALALKAIYLAQSDNILFNEDAKRSSRFNKITRALNNGKQYLLNTKIKKDTDEEYWSYNDKPGVAISMWALEVLSLFANDSKYWKFKEEFLEIKKRVIRFVYSQLPDPDRLDYYVQSELFFFAPKDQGVKYKNPLKNDKRFYTFIPHIVSILLDQKEDPFNPKIVTMVKWLLEKRDQRWAIEEYNTSSPCSISAAMAINVIVKWLKQVSLESFSRSVTVLINRELGEDSCQYGLPCDRTSSAKLKKAVKSLLVPLVLLLVITLVLSAILPTITILHTSFWILSMICCALLLNSDFAKNLIVLIYSKRKDLWWEIIIFLVISVITLIFERLYNLITSIMPISGG